MSITLQRSAAISPPARTARERLGDFLPRIVLAPSFAAVLVFVYGFIIFTGYLSFTDSKILPSFDFVGWKNYVRLWSLPNWWIALENLAIFASLYIVICTAIGLGLAILLDQKIRGEGVLRPIYLYPMAISFIVTGTAWKWFLDPGIGIERIVRLWGWSDFTFDWIKDTQMAIYCVVIAAVWQSSGFVMAMFLAGLRGIDNEIIKAAQIDGASLPRIYWRIVVPSLRPVFFSTLMVVSHLAIKSFDLVIALTAGGPGYSTDLPATFMYAMSFSRGQVAMGAASAEIMLATVAAIVVPYLYSELRTKK